jgi:hypothetical protein
VTGIGRRRRLGGDHQRAAAGAAPRAFQHPSRLELAQRRPAVFALFLSGVPASMRPDVVLPLGAVVSARPDRRRR